MSDSPLLHRAVSQQDRGYNRGGFSWETSWFRRRENQSKSTSRYSGLLGKMFILNILENIVWLFKANLGSAIKSLQKRDLSFILNRFYRTAHLKGKRRFIVFYIYHAVINCVISISRLESFLHVNACWLTLYHINKYTNDLPIGLLVQLNEFLYMKCLFIRERVDLLALLSIQ